MTNEVYTIQCDGCGEFAMAVASSLDAAAEWLEWEVYDAGGIVLCIECSVKADDEELYFYYEDGDDY